MVSKEENGAAERRYLQAIYHLADCEARKPVSVQDVQEQLAFPNDEAERCCDFWTVRGALTWSARGHVELTRVGLTRAEQADGTAPIFVARSPFLAREMQSS
jgi:hypothetical protein